MVYTTTHVQHQREHVQHTFKSSTTVMESAALWMAVAIARRFSFLFILMLQSRGRGPKMTPPPGNKGLRLLPIRALPVPFWAKGFRPPPRTSARVFVLAVPRRAFCRTVTKYLYGVCEMCVVCMPMSVCAKTASQTTCHTILCCYPEKHLPMHQTTCGIFSNLQCKLLSACSCARKRLHLKGGWCCNCGRMYNLLWLPRPVCYHTRGSQHAGTANTLARRWQGHHGTVCSHWQARLHCVAVCTTPRVRWIFNMGIMWCDDGVCWK